MLYVAAVKRERTDSPASRQSIIPWVPGLPAGLAVMLAVLATAAGFGYDYLQHRNDLTNAFSVAYLAGCVLAAMAVRYRGLFTTFVTPPLLLFIAVPLSYQALAAQGSTSLRQIVLALALPLVRRFPLMALATGIVLLVILLRVLVHRRGVGTRRNRPRRSDPRDTRSRRSAPARPTAADDRWDRPAREPRRRPPQTTMPPSQTMPPRGGRGVPPDRSQRTPGPGYPPDRRRSQPMPRQAQQYQQAPQYQQRPSARYPQRGGIDR